MKKENQRQIGGEQTDLEKKRKHDACRVSALALAMTDERCRKAEI